MCCKAKSTHEARKLRMVFNAILSTSSERQWELATEVQGNYVISPCPFGLHDCPFCLLVAHIRKCPQRWWKEKKTVVRIMQRSAPTAVKDLTRSNYVRFLGTVERARGQYSPLAKMCVDASIYPEKN
jgi:hypothetical protein